MEVVAGVLGDLHAAPFDPPPACDAAVLVATRPSRPLISPEELPAYRRFVADAARLGAEQVFLEVRVSNAPAITLYRSEAFAAVARRKAYYPPSPIDGTREDALVMRLELDPIPDALGPDGHA